MTQKEYLFTNEQLLTILKEVTAAMEVKEVTFFRIRAYQNVISAIEDLTVSVYDLWRQNRLDEISGIGVILKQHLSDLFSTGSVKDFEMVKKDLPEGMFALLGLRGIGAKKAFKLASIFKLEKRDTAFELLKKHAEKGEIRVLEGFGEKSELAILETLNEHKKHKNSKERMLLSHAEEIAGRYIDFLTSADFIEEASALGSLRRREATVGDLDIAAATTEPQKAIEHFISFPEVKEVTAKGTSRAAVILTNDVQVDLRVTRSEALGAMTQYFTGSKTHNINLRNYALEQGFSLSEYGIKYKDVLTEFATEEAFYSHIKLSYIPPELRQGKNEVELAKNGKLPDLIKLSDIQGDLHMHTTYSDGAESIEAMVSASISKGYKYIAITDHNPSVKAQGTFDVLASIENKRRLIEQLNSSQDDIRILFGFEVDILKSGELGLPDNLLSKLDFAIASIHTALDQPRAEITERLLKAIRNPLVKFIGHPSGRLINKRPPCDIDWELVLNEAKKHNKILEINAQPTRLDLADDIAYEARRLGIRLIINTDAHSVSELDNMKYGVDVARRAWCRKEDIVNTNSLSTLLKEFDIINS